MLHTYQHNCSLSKTIRNKGPGMWLSSKVHSLHAEDMSSSPGSLKQNGKQNNQCTTIFISILHRFRKTLMGVRGSTEC